MPESDLQAEPPRPNRPKRIRPRDEEEEEDREEEAPGAVETLIPYKNPLALVAYYLGVFSLIPAIGLLLGPASFILGLYGLRYNRNHPQAAGGGHAIAGIVLGGLTSLLN